jgi:hypothetical protein
MRFASRTVAALGAIAAVVACSSSGGTSNVSAMQACTDAANAICTKLDACSDFLVQLSYGNVSACESAFVSGCTGSLSAKGTSWTGASMEACAQAVPGAACSDLLSNNAPMACRPAAGTLANGAACGDDAQCQSQYCNKGTDGTCGACGARSTGGTCIRDDDCAYGNQCVGGKCIIPAGSGAACSAAQPCGLTLVCKNGACATPDAAGASCSLVTGSLFGTCDELAGNFCNLSMKCQTINLAAAGASCGLGQNGVTACSASGSCTKATGGTCTAAVAPGATCDAVNNKCAPPGECASGVCKVSDPSSCH